MGIVFDLLLIMIYLRNKILRFGGANPKRGSWALVTLILAITSSCHIKAQVKIIDDKKFTIHTVKPKETLYGLSKRYRLPIDSIIFYNPHVKKGLKVDHILKIPHLSFNQKDSVPKDTIHSTNKIAYQIKQGETLYSISKKFDMSINELIRLNPTLTEGLKTGQVIYIIQKNKLSEYKNDTTDYDSIIYKPGLTYQNINCDSIQSDKKRFNISLLLPFSDKSENGINAKVSVEFYNGILLGLDSLKKLGIDIHLYIYDTHGRNDSSKIRAIAADSIFDDMDMVIGPLYSANLITFNQALDEKSVPILSPFSRNRKIIQNNYNVIKATACEELLTEQTIRFLKRTYKNANFILLEPGLKKDTLMTQRYYHYLLQILEKDSSDFKPGKFYSSVAGVKAQLKKGTKNIIIFPASKEIMVKDFLTKINKIKKDYEFIIVGIEDWLRFNTIDVDYYTSLNLHIPTTDPVNIADSANLPITKLYRKKFKIDPTPYSFKGYHLLTYLGSKLMLYGRDFFRCLTPVNEKHLQNSFLFLRHHENEGLENIKINLLIFDEFGYYVLPTF